MTQLTHAQRADFARDGFILLKQIIPKESLDLLERHFLGLVREYSGKEFSSASSEDLATFLADNRDLEKRLYDNIRTFPWVHDFSSSPAISTAVRDLVGEPIGLMSKIPFRIDLPFVVRELAVWHQDHFYVRGNEKIITAWIPLVDVGYPEGCLLVMPGSHLLGPVKHDNAALGKRHYPTGIFERPVRYVEMKKGDLLLFDACLFHSSGVNISSSARLSVQARFSPLSLATDPQMGTLTPMETGIAS